MKVLIDAEDLRQMLEYALGHIPDGTQMTDPQGEAWERLWKVVEAPDRSAATDPLPEGLDVDGIMAALRARGFVQRGRSLLMPMWVNDRTGVTVTIDSLRIPVLSVSSTSDATRDYCTYPWQLITEAGIDRLLALDPGLYRQRPRC
jgi:hypothetical protein